MPFRISLVSVRAGGQRGASWHDDVDGYLERCGRDWTAAARVLRTEDATLQWVAEQRREGACALWLADLGGRAVTTEDFAGRIRTARETGLRHLILGIGPADGWTDAARGATDFRFSLSAMTLPHELARLLLAEQVYRAVTILQGHPYHCGH